MEIKTITIVSVCLIFFIVCLAVNNSSNKKREENLKKQLRETTDMYRDLMKKEKDISYNQGWYDAFDKRQKIIDKLQDTVARQKVLLEIMDAVNKGKPIPNQRSDN